MIGVLALQGGFAAHSSCLRRLGIDHREVRLARDLEGLDGLILPGGESTTMLKLMAAYDLFQPLRAFGEAGKPVLGTCAGAILMCDHVRTNDQLSLGFIPAAIDRNAYGSQRESFSYDVDCPPWSLEAVPSLFIRAPRFAELGPEVAVLARFDDDIIGVTYRHYVAVTFHPELGNSTRFHQAWYERYVAPVGTGVAHG